mmetsp:Transcript_2066/g.4608  ORF Transcript_2066/g.4608 Transcript_2066/m.4608 type:complete len:217 (+) Transcript_2066:481-1131(+)
MLTQALYHLVQGPNPTAHQRKCRRLWPQQHPVPRAVLCPDSLERFAAFREVVAGSATLPVVALFHIQASLSRGVLDLFFIITEGPLDRMIPQAVTHEQRPNAGMEVLQCDLFLGPSFQLCTGSTLAAACTSKASVDPRCVLVCSGSGQLRAVGTVDVQEDELLPSKGALTQLELQATPLHCSVVVVQQLTHFVDTACPASKDRQGWLLLRGRRRHE